MAIINGKIICSYIPTSKVQDDDYWASTVTSTPLEWLGLKILWVVFFIALILAMGISTVQAAYQEVPNSMVTFECTQDAQTMALLEGFTDAGKEISWWMVMYNLRLQPIPYGTYSLRVQNQYATPMDLEGATLIDDNKVVTLEKYKFIETTREYVSFPISIAKVVVNKPQTTITFRIPSEMKLIRKVSTTFTQLDQKGAHE